ncbi:pentapeptide repeat-containing protein [Dongia sedimenti]|uniref:Pentapeptide repeat-containing protein n=1 Tax=Dongia sedimenti TaxID=3064282 RepID=A0ABU0YM30_9PROT|nr:pentapeptide repeat-containing protein [Rhodospirillaceae bacterium R-7]
MSALERQEAQARIDKLYAEKRLIISQLQRKREPFRHLATFGSFLTALVAVGGLVFSIVQSNTQLSETRSEKVQARLDTALDHLGSSVPSVRLSAIANLKSFLDASSDSSERSRLVLSALAHSLAVEENITVRNALQEIVSRADKWVADKEMQSGILGTLASLSRGLVREGKLVEPVFDDNDPRFAIEQRARAIGLAISALARSGAVSTDFSGIYCKGCDFSGASGIANASFANALLSDSVFFEANLAGASFDMADLDAADFTRANLSHAKITRSKPRHGDTEILYAFDQIIASQTHGRSPPVLKDAGYVDSSGYVLDFGWQMLWHQPKFACANLTAADFTGFPMFVFVSNPLNLGMDRNQPVMSGANLIDADFSGMAFNFISDQSELNYPPLGKGDESQQFTPFGPIVMGEMRTNPAAGREPVRYDKSFAGVTAALAGTTWERAKWPTGLSDWLRTHRPTTEIRQDVCNPGREN